MKSFKLGYTYGSNGSIIAGRYEVSGWSVVKQLIGNLYETQKEEVVVCFRNIQDFFEKQKDIHLQSGKECIKVYLSCDADFVADLLTTDIIKADVKKVVVKKRKKTESIFEDPYKVAYIVKNNEHHICSYSFHTDNKLVLKRFMETVSAKALPSGKLDLPTNKKLVKLNKNALRKIKSNQF